jgi:hypothetical protein
VQYIYDAYGRRVAAFYEDRANLLPDVMRVYDGYQMIEERLFDDGSLKSRYYYEEGINKLALMEEYNSAGAITAYIPITDDRGTLMGVANASGQIIEKLYYNSTGLCKAFTGAGVEKLRSNSTLNLGRSEYIPFGWLGMVV